MALEQYFTKERKSMAPAAAADTEKASASFDCNICLDFASEPVVTLCGHLYCWPCIYKWFHFQRTSLASNDHPQCPVCKTKISRTTLVPLYGRGHSLSEPEIDNNTTPLKMVIPPRPSPRSRQSLMNSSNPGEALLHHNPHQNSQYFPVQYASYGEDLSSPSFNLGRSVAMSVFHPVIGMFGEMVYARVFGNSESLYAYPNSYHFVGSSSPRLRRQEMQADKSLNRISIFLFCCFLLCLLLF